MARSSTRAGPTPAPVAVVPTAVPHPDPEHLLPLAQAARILPPRRHGARPNPSTMHRWARKGIIGADGKRYRLRTTQLGSTTCTCRVWLAELSQALADAREAAHAPHTTAHTRKAQQQSARKTLREAGILDGDDDEKPRAPQGAVRKASSKRSRREGGAA